MRINKFRAWDDEIHHMYYPPNSHIAMWCDGGCINLQTGKKLIPLFWTGLTDKNGKEVFEGDIWKWVGGFIEEIKWDDKIFGFNIVILSFGEVIGNIFESPELLWGAK